MMRLSSLKTKLKFALGTVLALQIVIIYATLIQAGNLNEQLEQITRLAMRKPVIKLNTDKFNRFVGSQSFPRNYSFIVMLTALASRRNCKICRPASEEFTIVANSFADSPHSESKRLFFGLVDYDDGSDVFSSFGLSSAPVFLYFDEKRNFKKPDELSIQRLGYKSEVVAKWIQEKTGLSFKINRPPPSSSMFPTIFLILMVALVLYLFRHSLGILLNRNLWALIAVSIVLLMTSGQMWNHIRGAPAYQKGTDHNSYINPSSSSQFIVETYLVMVIYAGLAVGIAFMIDGLSARRGERLDAKKNKFQTRFGFFMLAFFLCLLLSIFKQKFPAYPYKLLFMELIFD